MTELLNMIHSMKKLYDHLCLDVMEKYHITRSELDILLFLNNNPEFDSAKDIVEKRGLVKSHASMGIEKLLKMDILNPFKIKMINVNIICIFYHYLSLLFMMVYKCKNILMRYYLKILL